MRPDNAINIMRIKNLSTGEETTLCCTDHLTLFQEVDNRKARGERVGWELMQGVIIEPGSIEPEKNPIALDQKPLFEE